MFNQKTSTASPPPETVQELEADREVGASGRTGLDQLIYGLE